MVIAEKPGYTDDSVSFSLEHPRKAQFSDTLYVELELQKIDSNFNPDSFLVATVYWDFDKHMLRKMPLILLKSLQFLGQKPNLWHNDYLHIQMPWEVFAIINYFQKEEAKVSTTTFLLILASLRSHALEWTWRTLPHCTKSFTQWSG